MKLEKREGAGRGKPFSKGFPLPCKRTEFSGPMIDKEISEIRRRISPEKNNIDIIRGRYINANRETICEFKSSFGLLTEDVIEKYLGVPAPGAFWDKRAESCGHRFFDGAGESTGRSTLIFS